MFPLTFPREMAFPERSGPYRVVYNKEQFEECLKKVNGRKNVYTSIYAFANLKSNQYNQLVPEYSSAIVDKIFFDFDTETCFENVKKLHEVFWKEQVQHIIIFSGKGFHLYAFCEVSHLDNKKEAIKNAQKHFADKAGLTVGDPHICDLDSTVFGDVAQVARVPNTYNIKHKRWCFPIRAIELVGTTFEDLKKKASEEKPYTLNRAPIVYGTKKIDMKLFDYIPPTEHKEGFEIPMLEHLQNISDEKFWPCVENMIVKRSGCHPWYWATVYFRDMGYSKVETEKIMEKYLSPFKRTDGYANDFLHYKFSDRHLDKVYDDKEGKHYFPSATTLFQKGLCPGRCPHYKQSNCLYYNGNKEEYT